MTCEEYEIRIGKLLDDELSPTDSAGVFSHLAICQDCRRWFHANLRLSAELSKQTIRPEGTEHLIRTAELAPHPLRIALPRGPRPSSLALFTVLVLLVGVIFSASVYTLP